MWVPAPLKINDLPLMSPPLLYVRFSSHAVCLTSGVTIERTGAGFEARLRITGFSRFFGVPFLTVWLLGWAAGEVFALCMLAVGAWSLLTGQPPGAGRAPLRPEVALPIGLFLLFWLALWTLGGVMAARE